MSEQLKEALSAAMDNEADAFELRRVLDESCADPELREQWHRMHLARSVLQDEAFYDGRELRQKIWAEMEGLDESAVSDGLDHEGGEVKSSTSNWWGRVTGSAVAVAVAALVVVNADSIFSGAETSEGLEVANISSAVVAPVTPVLYSEATPQDRLRLDAMRMRHYQQNAINRTGAVSFVRMMTFKQSQPKTSRRQNTREE